MSGTVITDLRRRGAVDPSRVLTGPLRAVGLQWLEPGRSVELTAEGVERALYITAGSGTATAPEAETETETETEGETGAETEDDASTADDSRIPLVEGTAVTLPLGARTVLTAGTAGLEFFHAVLAVAGHPGRAMAHPAAERPTTERPAAGHPADRPTTERPATERPAAERPGRAETERSDPDHPHRPETPPSPKGGEPR
ncbi:hypothetical protein [Kitasatospora sp. NPDC056184]|uniref:hypothetical protein n=1 Tax=Kitasatospora sp. NPDC056184 TaxID=3345738 RepID=UPI0035E2FA20